MRKTGAILMNEMDGTKPLKTFWDDGRKDNIGVVTDETKDSLAAEGVDYQEIRTEGYVYTEQKEGTIPLKLFWNGERNDNMLCADEESIQSAEEAGYTEVRTEGYVLAAGFEIEAETPHPPGTTLPPGTALPPLPLHGRDA